jgi:hypothetical protein
LRLVDIQGEVCVYGGAAMCLAFDARPSTRDVDAVFVPTAQLREAAKKVAAMFNLRENWLNDGAKGFLVEHNRKALFDRSHLRIYIPEPEYLLAMKVLAARVDTNDKEDAMLLLRTLKINSVEAVFSLLQKYYPSNVIRPATRFFVEELMKQ